MNALLKYGFVCSGFVSGRALGSITPSRCDGNHETSKCPHFRKDREKHISAWENYGKKGVVAGNQEVTKTQSIENILFSLIEF